MSHPCSVSIRFPFIFVLVCCPLKDKGTVSEYSSFSHTMRWPILLDQFYWRQTSERKEWKATTISIFILYSRSIIESVSFFVFNLYTHMHSLKSLYYWVLRRCCCSPSTLFIIIIIMFHSQFGLKTVRPNEGTH